MKKNFYFVWFISTKVIHHQRWTESRRKKSNNSSRAAERANSTQSIFNLFVHKWHHLNAFTRLCVCRHPLRVRKRRRKSKKIIRRKTLLHRRIKKISIGCTDHVSNYANTEGSDSSLDFVRRVRVENSWGEAQRAHAINGSQNVIKIIQKIIAFNK